MPFSGQFVDLGSLELHVLRMQSEGPTLVLLHGLTDSGACWEHVAHRLWPEFDVVALDLRGHGLSDAPAGGVTGYAASDHARDAARVMDVLGLGSATIIGHSLGAETAAELACMRPDLVRGLVLEDPPWSDDWMLHAEGRERQRREWLRSIEQLKSLRVEDILGLGRAQSPRWAAEELTPWAHSKREFRVEALDYFRAERPAWQLTLRQVKCPALLVTGEVRRGALVSGVVADQARSVCSALEVWHVAAAGHCVHRDQLDAYLSGVRTFLERT